jgi:hypothetical protein
MRRLLWICAVIGLGSLAAHAATPVWITPDVPTDETLSGSSMMPWEIWKYDGASYTLALSVPGNPDLNAIHKLDLAGDWLFSVEAPSDLGGLLPLNAEPRDVIWFHSASGSYLFCLRGATTGIPPGTGIDSIQMAGGDQGDLILGFDVPTDFPGFPSFEPADLVRFGPNLPGICPNSWTLLAANPEFDASAASPAVPLSTNTDGADGLAAIRQILAFDVPTDLPPFAGPAAFVPGQLAEWNSSASAWLPFETLIGWPISSVVDALSCGGTTPGRVDPPAMTMRKAVTPVGDIILDWPGSCASGAQDYGIYEGAIGTWYGHSAVACTDTPPLLSETITPGAADHYYLVVPLNDCNRSEGSYGRCSAGLCLSGDERPIGTAVCAAPQVLPTPPACP